MDGVGNITFTKGKYRCQKSHKKTNSILVARSKKKKKNQLRKNVKT